ncbi:MAG: SgcJ/EcaC family oxidoreductase [Hyphomonadaceae bacterium]
MRVLILAAALAACGPQAPRVDIEAEAAAIQERANAQAAAIAAHDADAAIAFYAEDATLFAPGAAISDSSSLREGMTHMLADPNLALEFSTDRVAVSPDGAMAVASGGYAMTATDEATQQPRTESGHYVTVWRKDEDGVWRIIADINTPGPAPAPPVAAPAP